MKTHKSLMMIASRLAAAIAVAAVALIPQTAMADSAEAMCEFYKHGDEKENRSGPCTFSQRQGYIDIDLRNGQTFSLSPGNKPDHFKDQNGNMVERVKEGGNAHVYKWEHKRIVVKFGHHGSGSHHSSGNFGETPHDLRDLVGEKGGQAERELRARGYVWKNSSESGGSVYSNWKERDTGRCVTIRTEDGRYQSIIYSSDYDCDR